MMCDEPCCPGMAKLLPADGEQRMDSLCCCAKQQSLAFAIASELSLCQHVSSCTFTFLILCPIPHEESERLYGDQLPAGGKPQK